MQIHFFFEDCFLKIPARRRLKTVLKEVFQVENTPLNSLTYIFCSDAYLLRINQQFLKHDDFTDIITFCLSEPKKPVEGEIYISVDRVKENARKYKAPVKTELYRVIFHGALHLCGYQDKSPENKIKMSAAEDRYLVLMQ